MKEKAFNIILLTCLVLCLVVTTFHVIWALYAYEHSSIIYFISKELWW